MHPWPAGVKPIWSPDLTPRDRTPVRLSGFIDRQRVAGARRVHQTQHGEQGDQIAVLANAGPQDVSGPCGVQKVGFSLETGLICRCERGFGTPQVLEPRARVPAATVVGSTPTRRCETNRDRSLLILRTDNTARVRDGYRNLLPAAICWRRWLSTAPRTRSALRFGLLSDRSSGADRVRDSASAEIWRQTRVRREEGTGAHRLWGAKTMLTPADPPLSSLNPSFGTTRRASPSWSRWHAEQLLEAARGFDFGPPIARAARRRRRAEPPSGRAPPSSPRRARMPPARTSETSR